MTKISGQFLISGQFQDNFEISGISGQLGALQAVILLSVYYVRCYLVYIYSMLWPCLPVHTMASAWLTSTRAVSITTNIVFQICYIFYGTTAGG